MMDLSKHIGYTCKLRNGYLATIERNPDWDGYGIYEFLVKYDCGRSWTVTKDGYVWNTKSPHDFDVTCIFDEHVDEQSLTESNLVVSDKKEKSTKKSKKTQKVAYLDFNDETLKFATKVPTGRMLEVIGYDVTEREMNLLRRLYDAFGNL